MKPRQKTFFIILIIAAIAGLLFIPFSGAVHLFDWDEIIFAESAREMIATGDYLTVMINFEPFYEKPPLFIWMQVLSMKIFGINEFAARFPNAICGIVTLVVLFIAGRKIFNQKFGIYWSLSHGTAILPFFYFQTGIIDPWFNLFIMVSILFFVFFLDNKRSERRYLNLSLSSFFLGLAVLTKGPVAIFIVIVTLIIYFSYKSHKARIRSGHIIAFLSVLAITGGSWFIIYAITGDPQVLMDFIAYQIDLFSESFTTHDGFPGFHFVLLIFGMFPASIFAMRAFTKKKEPSGPFSIAKSMMVILLGVVLVLFSLVETKLVHYSSLAYFPISFLAAYTLERWTGRKLEFRRWHLVLLGGIAFLTGIILLFIPYMFQHKEFMLNCFEVKLSFLDHEYFNAFVNWSIVDYFPGFIMIAGSAIAIYFIRKRDVLGIYLIHFVSLVFIYSSIMLFVPKTEKMIQHSMICYFKEHSENPYPVISLGFKSYAQYFYGKWQPGEIIGDSNEAWINNYPYVRVIIKAERLEKMKRKHPELKITGEENGFVFGIIDKL